MLERELGKDRALQSQPGSPWAGFRLQALLLLEAGLCLCVQNVPWPCSFSVSLLQCIPSRGVCPLQGPVPPGDPAGKVNSGQATQSPVNNRTWEPADIRLLMGLMFCACHSWQFAVCWQASHSPVWAGITGTRLVGSKQLESKAKLSSEMFSWTSKSSSFHGLYHGPCPNLLSCVMPECGFQIPT